MKTKILLKINQKDEQIQWETILGKNWKDWFVKIDYINTNANDYILYSENDSDTIIGLETLVKAEDVGIGEKYVYRNDFSTTFIKKLPDAHYEAALDLAESRKLYRFGTLNVKIITLGNSVMDSSYYRCDSIRILDSIFEEFYVIIGLTAEILN